MISFEKALRETHNISYKIERNAAVTFIVTGKFGKRTYTDDTFCSVAGALVDQIAALHPDLRTFQRSAMVQLGGGVDVANLFDTLDLDRITEVVHGLPDTFQLEQSEYDHLVTMVIDRQCHVSKLKLFDTLHKIFKRIRVEKPAFEQLSGAQEPYATAAEIGLVMTGQLVKSIKAAEHPQFMIPAIKTLITAAHPRGKWEDNGDFIIRSPFDPFSCIGSTELDCAYAEMHDVTAKAAPIAGNSQNAAPEPKNSCEIDAAVELVNDYVSLDYNSQDPETKIIMSFGSADGEVLWKSLSQQCRLSAFKKGIDRESHTPEAWIRIYGQFLAKHGNRRLGLPENTCYILAAGRTLACKSQIEFGSDYWRKR